MPFGASRYRNTGLSPVRALLVLQTEPAWACCRDCINAVLISVLPDPRGDREVRRGNRASGTASIAAAGTGGEGAGGCPHAAGWELPLPSPCISASPGAQDEQQEPPSWGLIRAGLLRCRADSGAHPPTDPTGEGKKNRRNQEWETREQREDGAREQLSAEHSKEVRAARLGWKTPNPSASRHIHLLSTVPSSLRVKNICTKHRRWFRQQLGPEETDC